MAGSDAPGGARDRAVAFLTRRDRLRLPEALPWAIAIAAFFLFPDYLTLGTQVLIMVLFALSLDLILGYAGIVSLGHATFFGAGAYAVGLLSVRGGWGEPLSGLLVAGAAAAVLGLVSGWFLLRYRGLTILMLTLATAVLVQQLGNARDDITGGFDGLNGIAIWPLFGHFDYDLYGQTYYLYSLGIVFLVFCALRRIVHSFFGRSLIGIRESALRMEAIGAPVHRRLVTAYTISAAIAGIAGGLYAQSNAFVTLEALGFDLSATVLVMLVLGGAGRLYGAFLGTVTYMLLQDRLAKQSPEFWEFGIGLLLVVAVMFVRGGLFGIIDRIRAKRA